MSSNLPTLVIVKVPSWHEVYGCQYFRVLLKLFLSLIFSFEILWKVFHFFLCFLCCSIYFFDLSTSSLVYRVGFGIYFFRFFLCSLLAFVFSWVTFFFKILLAKMSILSFSFLIVVVAVVVVFCCWNCCYCSIVCVVLLLFEVRSQPVM